MPLRKYDWAVAEEAFIKAPHREPQVTLKVISKLFGIPYQTVRRYAAAHEWVSRRDMARYRKTLPARLKTARNEWERELILRELNATNVEE